MVSSIGDMFVVNGLTFAWFRGHMNDKSTIWRPLVILRVVYVGRSLTVARVFIWRSEQRLALPALDRIAGLPSGLLHKWIVLIVDE